MHSDPPGLSLTSRPRLVAALVFLLSLLASAVVIWRLDVQRVGDFRNQAYAVATDHANAIVNHLEHALSAVYALDALVQQARGEVTDFEEVATKMLPNYPGVSVLIQAPAGVISHAVPLQGNEKAIGLNLLQDPVMRAETLAARRSGKLTLAGPLELRQGGMGLVARLPVFLDRGDADMAFWGFVNVVLKLPQALDAVKLPMLVQRGFDYKLWRVVPDTGQAQVIAESARQALAEPVRKSFSVPNGAWTLSVAPRQGWGDPSGLALKAGVALLWSALLAYLVKLQLRQIAFRHDLQRQVHERTMDIQASQRQLAATLDAIPDLLFEMDLQGRYHACHAPISQASSLAAPVEDLLGKTVQQVLPEVAALVVLDALAQAQRDGASHGHEIELPGNGGSRWFALSVARKAVEAGQTPRLIVVSHDITDRKQAEADIAKLAYFDALTALPNRTLLDDRMARALAETARRKSELCVMFLDLDHFKNINDTLGHAVGDALLVQVARRMQTALRDQDTVARFGGDEFIVLLPDTGVEGAAHVAQNILNIIGEPITLQGRELTVTPSIGIAVWPRDGNDVDTLFKHADVAMYRAKRVGRNGFQFYTQELQQDASRVLLLENELRRALERNQFSLHYQPQLSLHSGKVVGVEALLRWHHPELGAISPAEFIPVAESSGQILAIGQWVLETALAQTRQWQTMGLTDLCVAVNVSAMQFRQPDLPQLVQGALDRFDLPASSLEIELTESVAQQDPVGATAIMAQLRQIGVKLAIDDFGTGYSSLSYLKRFAATRLKIDQSFVREICSDPDDLAIVRAIIGMARSLGLGTIAEGVETAAQLAVLRGEGCDEVQGYLFGRPLPVADATAYLLDRQANALLQQT